MRDRRKGAEREEGIGRRRRRKSWKREGGGERERGQR